MPAFIFSASAVLVSKKENSSAAHSPAGEQLLSVAELRAAIFSHLDARTLFAFRAFCFDWYVSVVCDPHSREVLLLSPLAEQPCTEAELDKQLFRSRNRQNDVAFLSTSIPRGQVLPSPYYSGAAIKLLNIGLSAQSGDIQLDRTISSGHQTSIAVLRSCINAVRVGDIGYKMLLVSPPVQSLRFQIDEVYQLVPGQWGMSTVGPYDIDGEVTEETGVTMGDLQTSILSRLKSLNMFAGSHAEVKLIFDNVVLLKPDDMMSVEKQREEDAEEKRELEMGHESSDGGGRGEEGSGPEDDNEA